MPSKLPQDKYRRYLRAKGIRADVDAAPVRAHILYLREHPDGGMTCQAIADAAGVAMSVVSVVGRGSQLTMRDTIAEKILAVEYRGWKDANKAVGAWMDPTGTIRRLQALYAVGWTCTQMAETMNHPNPRVVWHYMQNKYVTAMVAQRVKAMYEKLRYVNPRDMGVFPPVITRNKNMAKKNGWAPPSCWDDDEIDNPLAEPEWTGACGSMKGVRLHRKHSIMPLCARCKAAQTRDLEAWRGTRAKEEGDHE